MTMSLEAIDKKIQDGKTNEAMNALNAHDLADPQVKMLIGICHFREKNFEEAETTFRQTIASVQNSNAYKAWYYLGLALERQSKIPDAKTAFVTSNALNPKFQKARKKLVDYGVDKNTNTEPATETKPRLRTTTPNSNNPVFEADKQGIERGVAFERKSALVYNLERFFKLVFNAFVVGIVLVGGAIASGIPALVLPAVVISLLFGLVVAGGVSRRK